MVDENCLYSTLTRGISLVWIVASVFHNTVHDAACSPELGVVFYGR